MEWNRKPVRGGSVSVAPESGAGKSPESDKGENADAAQVGTAAFGAAPGAAEMGAMAVRVVSGAAALAARSGVEFPAAESGAGSRCPRVESKSCAEESCGSDTLCGMSAALTAVMRESPPCSRAKMRSGPAV